VILLAFGLLPAPLLLAEEPSPIPHLANEAAVQEVKNGTRTLANAAWWGADPEDATESLPSALSSGAKSLIIPYLGHAWIVRPLQLPSNQEILIEPGVVLLAKKGEFQGQGDSLFTAVGRSNLVIRGYGACLRMRKSDYQHPPYQRAEWRMGLALRGCRHVLVEGLRVESTGGDGFYVDGGGDLDWSEDITLRNCVAHDNHRQGLSVISAVNLLVENCVFSNTWGTAPEAGIDLEPDTDNQRLVNCTIRNSVFENNNGHQILIYLKPLSTNSQPVSIRFENCLSRMTDARFTRDGAGPTNGLRGVAGIAVGEIKDNGPQGIIEFLNCVTEDTTQEGLRIYDKSAINARVRLINCSFRNAWQSDRSEPKAPRAPLLLQLRSPERTTTLGGVDFINCYVYDSVARPALCFDEEKTQLGLHDVHGNIFVKSAGMASVNLGPKIDRVDLKAAPGL
jgi:hypothetical protein